MKVEELQLLDELVKRIKGSRFLPKFLKGANDADILYTIMRGREIDLSPLQSLACLYAKEGKLCVDSNIIKCLVLRAGHQIEPIEWTVTKCKLQGTRNPGTFTEWKQTAEFTLEDARLEGVLSRPFWTKSPKSMLYARCVSILGRNFFSDCVMGLYSTEECDDFADTMAATEALDGGAGNPATPSKTVLGQDAPKVVTPQAPGNVNLQLNKSYLIHSPIFNAAQKLKPLGEWSCGAVRYSLGNQAIKSTLLPEDIEQLKLLEKELTKGLGESIEDIKLGEE